MEKLKSELTNGKLAEIDNRNKDDIRVTCPTHKDGHEDHPSCGIYNGDDPKMEKGFYHCFTCGDSGPLYRFVARCFNRDDEFGKKWLVDRFGEGSVEATISLAPIDLKATKEHVAEDSDSGENEVELLTLQTWHPYMAKRKLTRKVCEQFEVKYDPKTECIVFPVRDEYGDLIMFTRRSVNSKQFYIEENKEKPLYLYYFIKQHDIREVTLVESQINCLTLWGWNIPSCAMFGTGTKYQYDIINKSSINHIYLALDGDGAGDHGIERLLKNLKKSIIIDIIKIPRGKDVNDLSEEEFCNLHIISSQLWLKEYLDNGRK